MSKILVDGGLIPTTRDTVLDARTRVKTFDDIANIENPAKYLVITVEDTGKKYEVRKLTSKIIAGLVVENAAIDINDPEALVDLGLAEELRSEDEKVRQSNEKKRIEAENLRKAAEDSRKVNETNRVSAEGVREASERTRVSSEETRNANEQTRNSNETKRQSQESTRQTQESARQTNESARNTNESARKEAESERKTEETSRRTAELSRSTAENTRVKNEQNRTTAENTRSSAEDRRVANETQRTANETARNNAELSREQAEGNRASAFNTLKGQMQTTIQEGQTAVAATEKATSDAQKVVDEYDKKVAEQDGKLTELASEVDDFKDTITNQVNNYRPIEINGNVTNAADEEDLTSDNGLLKLKNRNNLNGMGYVILRKNKSFSEQLTQTNTIYEIRYNFDLNNLGVNIPEDCVLKFNGGSIVNGKIVGDNTIIESSPIHIFYNIELSGSFGLEYYVEWFGANSKILNNEIIFNHAITQINKTSSGGVLLINGRYVISDTVYLRNGVSLKGVFTLDAEYSATPKDDLKGAALLFNFNDTSKWVIDTFTYQKDSTEQGIIDAKTLHVTYEGLGWGSIRKSGWLIEDISIQAYKANTDAVKYCVGGIRLGHLLHSVVSRVYVYDVAVGMCINIAWGTTIKDCTIVAYYIGLYAGYLVTDINVNNCVINRTYYGNDFYVEDKPNFLSTNTIPPYVDNLISCAIVVESSGTDSTKLHLENVIAQLYNGFLIANYGNINVSNLYLEGINDFIAWTHSGDITIESIKFLFKKTNNYTFGTNTGTIRSNKIRDVRCYSPSSGTINDNRYIINEGFMWYDDYTIIDGVATPIKKCPVKQINMSECNTYYIGYYPSTKYFDYNYSELASGENISCPTTFTEIVNRGINNAKLVVANLTDMANVEIINSEYTIIPSVNANYAKRLYQSKPIVLKDSKLILGKNDKWQMGFVTKGNYDKNLDGKTYDVTQITHVFEVEGNCELSFSAYIGISEGNEGYAPIKLIGTRPIYLKVYLPANYYIASQMFLNLEYTTRYHIEVFFPSGKVVTFVNTTKPMNGNKIGDTWIEDGKPIYWTGTKWVDATGTDV